MRKAPYTRRIFFVFWVSFGVLPSAAMSEDRLNCGDVLASLTVSVCAASYAATVENPYAMTVPQSFYKHGHSGPYTAAKALLDAATSADVSYDIAGPGGFYDEGLTTPYTAAKALLDAATSADVSYDIAGPGGFYDEGLTTPCTAAVFPNKDYASLVDLPL